MSHAWHTISVGDQIPEGAVPTNDDATLFVGRAGLSLVHDPDWDYQIAEILVDPDTKIVKQISTTRFNQIRNSDIQNSGEVLVVSTDWSWKPAKQWDVIPTGAIQFMTNSWDGPCVVARCLVDGSPRPGKLTTAERLDVRNGFRVNGERVNARTWYRDATAVHCRAGDFCYLRDDHFPSTPCRDSDDQSYGDILVVVPYIVIITCENITGHDGPGSIECTKLNGDVIGIFEVPEGEEPYGPWLSELVGRYEGTSPLHLVKSNGDFISSIAR